MLKTPTMNTFNSFQVTRETYKEHANAINKKLKKIKKLAIKYNDVITYTYADDMIYILLSGNRTLFEVTRKRLEKSLAKLQTLTEPYTFEEYFGKRYHITEDNDVLSLTHLDVPENTKAYLFVDTRSDFAVTVFTQDGKLLGCVGI